MRGHVSQSLDSPLRSRKDGHGIEGDGNENDKHLINDKNQKFPTMLSLLPSLLKL